MKNIRLYQYFELEEKEMLYYANAFKYGKVSDTLGGHKAKKLTSLSFGDVSKIRDLATTSDYPEIFNIVFGISEKDLNKIRVKEFFMAFNWLQKELEVLISREDHLKGEEDPKLIQAGVERLNSFKGLNILIPLSKAYGKTLEEIESWKYSTIFAILFYDKVNGEIEREYNRLTVEQ
jgi:hypothetical protein